MNWKTEVETFKAALQVEAPRISQSAFRIAFFGSVGSGKSVTAGICAVGITASGSIGWVDGEAGRSGMAIDIVCDMASRLLGGSKADWLARFQVIHLSPPFNPLRVVAAMDLLTEKGCSTVILDCLTQAWEEDGGYLDMREAEIEKMSKGDDWKRDKVAMAATAHIKPWTHGKLVSAINQSTANLILCFQGKTRTTPKRNDQGKIEIVTSDVETPIQESGLTRTAIAAMRVETRMHNDMPEGGFCFIGGSLSDGTKYTHPRIRELLPKNGEQFEFKHGQGLANWQSGKVEEKPVADPTPAQPDERTVAASDLWELVKGKFKKRSTFQAFCQEQGLIETTEELSKISTERIRDIHRILKLQLEKGRLSE